MLAVRGWHHYPCWQCWPQARGLWPTFVTIALFTITVSNHIRSWTREASMATLSLPGPGAVFNLWHDMLSEEYKESRHHHSGHLLCTFWKYKLCKTWFHISLNCIRDIVLLEVVVNLVTKCSIFNISWRKQNWYHIWAHERLHVTLSDWCPLNVMNTLFCISKQLYSSLQENSLFPVARKNIYFFLLENRK